MTDSILDSIKKLLGIASDYTAFDEDVITHINGVFFTLNQLGYGPDDGFVITSKNDLWSSYLGVNRNDLELIKPYIYLKVRLVFDPPQTSFLLDAIQKQISEMEFRINIKVETPFLR